MIDLILAVQSGATPAAWQEDAASRQRGEAGALPFPCIRCGNREHAADRFLLNTRTATLFGFDAYNERALCILCKTCGYIHWFVHGSPGAFQAMHPSRRHLQARLGDEAPGGCLVYGFDRVWTRQALVGTRALAFLSLDWLNQGASMSVCGRCGFAHWANGDGFHPVPRADHTPPNPPLGPECRDREGFTCLTCNHPEFHARPALLPGRVLTHLGLEWLGEGEDVLECAKCKALEWSQR